MAPDKHPGEPRPPPRHHTHHSAEAGRKRHAPAGRHQAEGLKRLVEHVLKGEELAREQEAYELLFRRHRGRRHHHQHRQGPSPPPSPPCLRCALSGMRCSAAQAGGEEDVRCRRCERAGAQFCIRQAGPAAEVLDPEVLGEALGGGHGRAREAEPMLYCLDPVLRDDRGRLLDVAAGVLDGGDGVRFVHGTRVNRVQAKNFALPMWHQNDEPENRSDPGYVMRMPEAYFEEVEVRRKDKLLNMKMKGIEQEGFEAE